jgi:hypothetical protein
VAKIFSMIALTITVKGVCSTNLSKMSLIIFYSLSGWVFSF